MALAIRFEFGLWLAWLAPLLFPLAIWRLAILVWKSPTSRLEVSSDFRGVYVAGTAVLAVAVPLVGNLILEARGSDETVALGLLLAAATLAIMALVLGAYLIYKLSPDTSTRLAFVGGPDSSTSWAPIAGSVQFSCVIMFLLTTLGGLALFAITAPNQPATSTRKPTDTIAREFPELGTTTREAVAQLGPPSDRGPDWLEYELPNSTILLCFSDDSLEIVLERPKEDSHAVRRACQIHRGFPRPR